ncbi:MAG: hypothetical protein WAU75_02905 [Solirubrobacteraceae bacterium]
MFTAPSRLSAVAAVIVAATVIAACGANSPTASTVSSSAGHLTQAQLQREMVSFAGCMRSHGAPGFPDPSSPQDFKSAVNQASGGHPRSPAFQSANTACLHLLPGGSPGPTASQRQAQTSAGLAFARCLRSHRFPTFPDPTSGGELTHQMLANAGIDVHQPAVVQAADACVGVTHGLITKASVARFVAGH